MSLSGYDAVPPRVGLAAIVAVGRHGAIGRAGALPWHIPEELAHFRRVTQGHALIMGSATWDSIGRPLPGRRIIVLSSRPHEVPAGVEIATSWTDALRRAHVTDDNPLVAGGTAVYRQALDDLDRLWWTSVDIEIPDADAHFPPLRTEEWAETASWRGADARLTYRVLDRIRASRA